MGPDPKSTEAALLLNGAPPSAELASVFWRGCGLRVCADGAADAALAMGLEPDLVVGDLDSVSAGALRRLGAARVRGIGDQDRNDGWKALEACLDWGAEGAHVLGWAWSPAGTAGGGLDHLFSNLELLAAGSRRTRLRMWTDWEVAEVVRGEWTGDLAAGARVSLSPLFGPARGVTLEGLRYGLSGGALAAGAPPSGVGNAALGGPARVRVDEGALLLTIGWRRPPSSAGTPTGGGTPPR